MSNLSPRDAFTKKHGGGESMIHSSKDHTVYFQDGATMEASSHGWMYEPETPSHRFSNKVKYWTLRLESATNQFTELRQQLRFQNDHYEKTGWGQVTQAEIDALKPLQEEVELCKEMLNRVQGHWDKYKLRTWGTTTPGSPQRGEQNVVDATRAALDAIKI